MRALGFSALILILTIVSSCATKARADYDRVASLYGDAVSYAGTDYDEFAKILDTAESTAASFLTEHPDDGKRPTVEKILDDVKKKKSNLARESADYQTLTKKFKKKHTASSVDGEIAAVDAFLGKYPDAVVRPSLEDHVQDLVFQAVSLTTKPTPSSLAEVDKQLAACRKYESRINDPAKKEEIHKRVSALESRRVELFDEQVAKATESLFSDMEDAAQEAAVDEHPFADVEKIEVVETQKRDLGDGRVEYTRTLAVHMRGSLVGLARHRLLVRTTGLVAVDPTNGADSKMIDARIVEDSRSSAIRDPIRLLRAGI